MASDTTVAFVPLKHTPENHPWVQYEGFQPGTSRRLSRGHVLREGYGAFPVNTILDIDSKVPMRDGINLYTNVFRPADGTKQPALIAWSPYGKCAGGVGAYNYDTMGPYRIGIDYNSLSGYETFEGPNPADWVARGYCVVDPDARGAMHSEGDIHVWGSQEAQDVYDLIDWCTKQSWCDGAAVMFGNSWLAISQINHASICPHPALKAIAPWEGATDMYKQLVCRGGVLVKEDKFASMITAGFAGYNSVEDAWGALKDRPLNDDFWESKHIHVENIKIPIYLTGSYSSRIHSLGSFKTFATTPSDTTWMRVHTSQEWPDLYKKENMDDLQKFYDHFTKGKDNGWQYTPHLRLSLLSMVGSVVPSVIERPEDTTTYPLPQTKLKKLFFDASKMTLGPSQPSQLSKATYEGHSLTDTISFTLNFDAYTELSGLPWAKLFVSCAEHDDLDIHVQIRKIGINGSLLAHNNYPVPVPINQLENCNVAKFEGPSGLLRASHSISQTPKQHPDDYPVYTHRERKPITPGAVVELEIPIWPIGMVFGSGEGISVIIAGHELKLPEQVSAPGPTEPNDENKGKHVVYTGGERASFLMLPVLKG
ncbi:Alpha/Beta hydrolase protein [Lophiotrema nucula]|uniref:Alpha/Beta hydrolase protein n=1 Tax=Lophiotrema nucula TaxID=690887 RepID=A0A6A5ZER4_9PLEO|nr:Alpha/Beta hydrolase protein [Lophiotrema nucula]